MSERRLRLNEAQRLYIAARTRPDRGPGGWRYDYTTARVTRDAFVVSMSRRELAVLADQMGWTLAEALIQKKDARKRLRAAAHTIRPVQP